MALSALYHTFSCRSEHDFNYFLSFDLFGIALSLLAIYTSGIYYAFWCHQVKSTLLVPNIWNVYLMNFSFQDILNFYLITVTVIFVVAMALQHPKFNINSNAKMTTFVLWAAYGVVPTIHWTIIMGGFDNPVVSVSTIFKRLI